MATLSTFKDTFHDTLTINFVCLSATSPRAASVRHWLKHTGVSSFLQPADTLRYQRGPARWHGLTSKQLPT
jgi:hypothetical protein